MSRPIKPLGGNLRQSLRLGLEERGTGIVRVEKLEEGRKCQWRAIKTQLEVVLEGSLETIVKFEVEERAGSESGGSHSDGLVTRKKGESEHEARYK